MNKITIVVSGIVVLVLGIVVGGGVYAQSVTRSGDAIVGRFDYVEFNADQDSAVLPTCMNSPTYETIPDMTKTFVQGGLLPNEVLVRFEAQRGVGAPEYKVRLLIDGIPQSGSGSGFGFSNGTNNSGTESWNFISDPVGPGTHTATLEALVVAPTSEPMLCFQSRQMIIQHR